MKKLMIMGGLMGFIIGFGFGWMNGVGWAAIFLRASVAALISGLLFRWWGRQWIRGLADSLNRRPMTDGPSTKVVTTLKK